MSQTKLQAEAKHWLNAYNYDPETIKTKLEVLRKKRGAEQTALREEMLKQYKTWRNQGANNG